MDLIADARFKFVRMDLTWEAVEKRKGVYEFEKSGYDVPMVHPYRPQQPETAIKDYSRLHELIKRYAPKGKEIPIISGECGY